MLEDIEKERKTLEELKEKYLERIAFFTFKLDLVNEELSKLEPKKDGKK